MSKVEYEAGISHSLENNEIQNKVFISFHLNSIKSLILNNKFKIILQDYNKREIINITNQNDIDMLEKKLGSYNSKFLHNILEDKKFLDTLDYDQKEDLIEEINMIEKNVLNYNTSYLYEKKEKMDTLEKYCNLLEQF